MNQMLASRKARLPWRQAAVFTLTLATAIIHFTRYNGAPMSEIFLLNGLGYLVLLAALFLPVPLLVKNRRWIRILLIGYAGLTILAWVGMGDMRLPLGWIDKAIEGFLIALLGMDLIR